MQCPFCKEEIIDGAIKCKHCGSMLNQKQPIPSSSGKHSKCLKWWQAILITLALLIVMLVGIFAVGNYFPVLVVVGTAIWAAIENSKLKLSQYKSGLNSLLMFIGCCLLWIVVFPFFLVLHSKVNNGVAELK